MPAKAPSMSALVLSMCLAACTNQDPYRLYFADGREVTGMIGIRSCLDAFRANVRLTPGGYDGVCAPEGKDGRVLRVRPRELTNLWYEKPPATEQDLSGDLTTVEVGRGALPPWALGYKPHLDF